MTPSFKQELMDEMKLAANGSRLTSILSHLSIKESSWYLKSKSKGLKPGPKPQVIAPEIIDVVVGMCTSFPRYGYKRIAVMVRRCGYAVSNKLAYSIMKAKGLLLQPRGKTSAESYQAAKLFELLPKSANKLWQMDVTYIHIPGHGWWYAVTVIDYFSRYLLALHLTPSYAARDCCDALEKAINEAKRHHVDFSEPVFLVTDNGSSFLAKRFSQFLAEKTFSHIRIQYRTPTQLGLLERFHRTLKQEEVYWNMYDNPSQARDSLERFRERYNCDRPHWALIPEAGGDPYVPMEVYIGHQKTRIPRWQSWAVEAKKKLDDQLAMSSNENRNVNLRSA